MSKDKHCVDRWSRADSFLTALEGVFRAGETLSEAGRARVLAASRVEWTVDFPKVSTRGTWMARHLDDRRAAAAMEATGASSFVEKQGDGPRTVEVGDRFLARWAVVIASDSRHRPIDAVEDCIESFERWHVRINEHLPQTIPTDGAAPFMRVLP